MRNFEIMDTIKRLKNEFINNGDYNNVDYNIKHDLKIIEVTQAIKYAINHYHVEEVQRFVKLNLLEVIEAVKRLSGWHGLTINMTTLKAMHFIELKKHLDIDDFNNYLKSYH